MEEIIDYKFSILKETIMKEVNDNVNEEFNGSMTVLKVYSQEVIIY